MHFLFALAAVAFSLNAAHAGPPSKTDFIQCGIDAGNRQDEQRRAFVEGCVSFKSFARQTRSGVDEKKPNQFHCRKQAMSLEVSSRKAFIEGCSHAKMDMEKDSTSSPLRKH